MSSSSETVFGRSKSLPRTNGKKSDFVVYSDSQVKYRNNYNNIRNVLTSNDEDTDVASCSNSELINRQKRKKSVKISRTNRLSRSFASSFKQDNNFRRSSNPEYRNRLYSGEISRSSVSFPANSVTAGLLLAHHTLKLSCPLLPIEVSPPIPAPLVVEDPPSSDNASDLEEDTVRHNIDPVFLNGSSGSFIGSAGTGITSAAGTPTGQAGAGSGGGGGAGSVCVARSAPSTPHGAVGAAGVAVALAGGGAGAGPETHSQPASPSYHHTHATATIIPRSPSHVFAKYEKGAIKQLSTSAPIMTAQARSPEPPSPKGAKAEKMPVGSSKARQKKFHRHFTQVDDDEKVLNYYSCALVGDILLQGHLYISKNYFAFYSNVFGYVTKVLIPIASVMKISKEKTAKIIPNAVGVATADDKHVFGSLLSRDSTYKLMMMVLKAATNVEAVQTLPVPKDIRPGELDASEFSGEESSSQSGNDSPTLRSGLRAHRHHHLPAIAKIVTTEKPIIPDAVPLSEKAPPSPKTTIIPPNPTALGGPLSQRLGATLPTMAKYNVFLLISTLLLLLLFTSAGVLLYRISRIQSRYSMGLHHEALVAPTADIYNDILHWQSQLHTKSAGAVHNFLDSNLDQIAKVRKSLEALSTLLMPNSPSSSQAQAPEHRSEVPPETNTASHSGHVVQDTSTTTS